ncbi:histidine kinase [Geodermatophilus sp. YIM 151500]|uniref:sensor histidine kinase n=1 Tax=Geodermatophilus sp. YIM 151500 TaxID=2984531 RepID=UPI0021E4CC3C|nr:histidine kinase [Geodermatophilus sp. YIM 151500]MCV2490216.1 histidine kinase [Geodermatophilus sp. YIM 151500]
MIVPSAVRLRWAAPRPRVSGSVPIALGGAAVLAALAGGVLHLTDRPGPITAGVTDWWLMQGTAALAYSTTGAWLARARPRSITGWLLLGIGATQALALLTTEYGVGAFARGEAGALPAVALWASVWLWSASLVALGTLLPLLLPDGRLPSPRWRPALALSLTAVVTTAASWALTPYDDWAPPDLVAAGARNPFGADWVVAGWVAVPVALLAVGAVAAAFAALFSRWRASAGEEREQLEWLLLGGVATVLLYAAGFAAGPLVTALAMVPLPAACLVAALRHGLWDADVAISRSLVYGALTACVLAAYVAVVGLLGWLLGPTTGAPIVVTAVVALLAEPLLRRLRVGVNRLVHGDREEPYALLGRLGARLEATRDADAVTDEVLPELVASVATALRLPFVAVELADGEVVAHGRRQGPIETVPLTYGGTDVGRLVVGVRPGGMRRQERRLLTGLARQAAVAVRTVLLTRDLDHSREQVVTAREEERRRLHRELHDGLGPSLAALALQAETARDLVDADPAAAVAVLDRVVPGLKTAVGEVRGVVSGLRPLALDDLGLGGALREFGSRFAAPGTTVEVSAADIGELPAAAEVAAYRIVTEAVANAARHAAPSRIEVQVRRTAGTLRVRVDDDGTGIPAASVPGVGLASMRARAAELGGSCVVARREPGPGTRVEVVLPLEAP